MRIGIDFDNTIVSYDALFHKVACEKNLIPHTLPVNKTVIRNFLREQNLEPVWTEMQGYVYGQRLNEATAYPHLIDTILYLINQGATVAIISHKTRYPYAGTPYNLHEAAYGWISSKLTINQEMLIKKGNIFFEETKSDKISRIKDFDCDFFIDDLPEILADANFPLNTRRVLFDPNALYKHEDFPNFEKIYTWEKFKNLL